MTKTFDAKPPSDARQLALEILLRVDEGAYADLALDAAFIRLPRLDPRDRGLTTELVSCAIKADSTLPCHASVSNPLPRSRRVWP